MKNTVRALGLVLILAGRAQASDETTMINVSVGDSGNAIEAAFDAGWSQGGGDYTCAIIGNELVVTDISGDCDVPVSRYNFFVNMNTTLSQNHSLDLRVRCLSPLVASLDVDSAGAVDLNPGLNVFVSGADTITVIFTNTPTGGIPTLSEWGLLILAALLLSVGVFFLRRRLSFAATAG